MQEVFIGEWSRGNLTGIMHTLRCFSLLSGLSINLKKIQLLGVGIPDSHILEAATLIGCSIFHTPFKYLGIMVGENMSSIWAWDETVNKLKLRLSSWKLKTLSIGGRLTLLKSVLRSTPIYNMSLFKVPKAVLKSMESIRRNFFNGIRDGEKKIAWVLVLSNTGDRRFWDLNGDGCFRVKDVRKMLDDMLLPKSDVPSRWVKQIPIKVNVLTWKISMDRLPTRVNLHWRGVQFVSVFFAGRNSKVAVRTGINNKMSGQITVKTSSSKYLALALTAVIPWLISGCKKLWPGDMENDWEQEMMNFMFAKNKNGFIDGSIKKPETKSDKYLPWMRCDAMIKGWLTTAMEKEIRNSVKYTKTAAEIWNDLMERRLRG
nr:RNA-directed DNA polymerase, eukaryota [Tanacetum cinerariifolium]